MVAEAKKLDPKGIVKQVKLVVQTAQGEESIKEAEAVIVVGVEVTVKVGDLHVLPP